MQIITVLFVALAAVPAIADLAERPSRPVSRASTLGNAIVYNNCPYDVYISSISKTVGCQDTGPILLATGQVYNEAYKADGDNQIRAAKSSQCDGVEVVSLDYYVMDTGGAGDGIYFDVSYVDCVNHDCPTYAEGFKVQSGATPVGNSCPTLSCTSPETCAEVVYVSPDDPNTNYCTLDSNTQLWLCGSG